MIEEAIEIIYKK